MNHEQAKTAAIYLKELRRCFPVFNAPERNFYNAIKLLINEYSIIHPDFTKETLIENIGEPKEIIARYLLDIDTDILYKSISFSKRVRTIATISFIIILIAVSIKIYQDYRSFRVAEESYINREIHDLEIH